MPDSNAAAVVTTLRNAGAVLDSFVAYHRAIGFEHLFLFFDDADDPDIARAGRMEGVTAIANDEALKEIWRRLPGWRRYGASFDREVMSRQLLNVEYAMELARARGYAWLLNIDSDELFFPPSGDVAEHFATLAKSPAETVRYLNYEAVPQHDEISDYFREVDAFKLPLGPVLQHLVPQLREAEASVPQLKPFFHFYSNGKSCVRLSAAGIIPAGVHEFGRSQGGVTAANSLRQFVLHYACCGFETFWTKYVTLGRFADKWWGTEDIAASIGTFHLEARDAVARGREEALAFYRARVAVTDPARIAELIRMGLLARINLPRRILETPLPGL